jgi:hypothetical protein
MSMGDIQGDMYGGPLKGSLASEDVSFYNAADIRQWALDTNPDAVIAAGRAYEDFHKAFQGGGDSEILGFLIKFGTDLDEAWGGPKSGAPQCQQQLAMLWQSAKELLEAAEVLGISLRTHGEQHLKPFKNYFQGTDDTYSQFYGDVYNKNIFINVDDGFQPYDSTGGAQPGGPM